MKWYWKIFTGLITLVLLVSILNIGVNLWIRHQLPKIINKKESAAYEITYKSLTVSLWNNTLTARDIIIIPKAAISDTLNKAGIYAKITTLEIRHFNARDLLFNDKIKAKSITMEQPKVTLYKKEARENIRESVVTPFDKVISVSDVFLHHGDLTIIYIKDSKALVRMYNINLQLEGILITENILKGRIPFQFENYKLQCDSLYYKPNSFYQLRTKAITTTKTDIHIAHFEMLPEYSRREFTARIPKEKDLYTLLCRSITATKTNWGFKGNDLFFHCQAVNVDQASANIYRSKMPADDLSKKDLYNKLLRDLKFDLKVDTLQVRNSLVEYEEEKSFQHGAGKLRFSRFNLLATSLRSGFKKEKLNDLKIKIHCLFMNSSPLNVRWNLNVMDKTDGFHIRGTLKNFDVSKMVSFTKPYMNVKTKGLINVVHFDFTGNDRRASGAFAIQYDGLKLKIYRKNKRHKENKLKTFIVSLFVRKNSKDELTEVPVTVTRIPEKSFYNFLWRSVEEGLKHSLL